MHGIWNSSLYLRHNRSRIRPALDLLSQIASIHRDPSQVRTVLDLGCGPGNITPHLLKQFPNARITGIDFSEDMIAAAKRSIAELCGSNASGVDGRVEFTKASMEDFMSKSLSDEEKYDIVYCNSSLHWLNRQDAAMLQLLKNVVSHKRAGGVLAIQMPDTKAQVSHLLMETAALKTGLYDKIKDTRIARADNTMEHYYTTLSPICSEVNIWSTEYLHELKYDEKLKQSQHPILEFTRATGLLPILESLGGEDTVIAKKYLAEYNRLLYEHYPISTTNKLYTHGQSVVLFPFKRIFVICRV